MLTDRKEKKRKDYTFRRQFNEKPSIIPGCPGLTIETSLQSTGFLVSNKASFLTPAAGC